MTITGAAALGGAQDAHSKKRGTARRASSDDINSQAPAHDQGASDSIDAQPAHTQFLELAKGHVTAFAKPQQWHSALVFGTTVLLWWGLLALGAWWFKNANLRTWHGLALSACWVIVRTGSYIRAFVIMHDAIHHALFRERWLNTLVAIVTGFNVYMDPIEYRRTHNQHHAVLGIEEEAHRDTDLIPSWTTRDWADWPRGLSKAAARVMCDPLVLYTVMAPIWILVFNTSWPHRHPHQPIKARLPHIAFKLTVYLPAAYAVDFLSVGSPVLHILAELLSQQLAVSWAMFLFCVQHTYEEVYRVPKAEYNRTAAGLCGASYLPIPWWWRWATVGVEYHHLHHLNARVPCYKLQKCHESAPPGLWEAAGVHTLTARDCSRALLQSLWDPDQRRYVPWPEWAWLDRLLA